MGHTIFISNTIKTKRVIHRINMRIKVKTDRRIMALKLYFCSYKCFFEGFSLFVRQN